MSSKIGIKKYEKKRPRFQIFPHKTVKIGLILDPKHIVVCGWKMHGKEIFAVCC